MNYKNINDYELMYMVRENEETKEIIFEKYRPIVEKYAKKYYKGNTTNGIDLEDVMQEGYIALNKAIDAYNGDYLFYTFATLCIRRHIQNYITIINGRKSTPNKKYYYNDEGLDYLDVVEAKDYLPQSEIILTVYQEKVKEIMNNMSLKQSSIFELKYNGFTAKEISILLDISINSINTVLSRIKNIFKNKGIRVLIEENIN